MLKFSHPRNEVKTIGNRFGRLRSTADRVPAEQGRAQAELPQQKLLQQLPHVRLSKDSPSF